MQRLYQKTEKLTTQTIHLQSITKSFSSRQWRIQHPRLNNTRLNIRQPRSRL